MKYSKWIPYSSLQLASLLQELTCHMESCSVTCHAAEFTFPPLPQPVKVEVDTWFSYRRGMQGWADL